MAQSVNIIWEYLTEKYDTTDDDNSTHLTGLKYVENCYFIYMIPFN